EVAHEGGAVRAGDHAGEVEDADPLEHGQPRSRNPSITALTSGIPVRAIALIRALASARGRGGLAARPSAYRRTSVASAGPGTTRWRRPHAAASAAEWRRPSMMISFARAGPTSRTKRVVDATPSGTPRSTSGIQNSASAAAHRKSQASVSPQPPPTAWMAQRVPPVRAVQRDGRDTALANERDVVAHDARTVSQGPRRAQRTRPSRRRRGRPTTAGTRHRGDGRSGLTRRASFRAVG